MERGLTNLGEGLCPTMDAKILMMMMMMMMMMMNYTDSASFLADLRNFLKNIKNKIFSYEFD